MRFYCHSGNTKTLGKCVSPSLLTSAAERYCSLRFVRHKCHAGTTCSQESDNEEFFKAPRLGKLCTFISLSAKYQLHEDLSVSQQSDLIEQRPERVSILAFRHNPRFSCMHFCSVYIPTTADPQFYTWHCILADRHLVNIIAHEYVGDKLAFTWMWQMWFLTKSAGLYHWQYLNKHQEQVKIHYASVLFALHCKHFEDVKQAEHVSLTLNDNYFCMMKF